MERGFVAAKIRSKGRGGTHPSFFKRCVHASLRKPTTAKGRGVQDWGRRYVEAVFHLKIGAGSWMTITICFDFSGQPQPVEIQPTNTRWDWANTLRTMTHVAVASREGEAQKGKGSHMHQKVAWMGGFWIDLGIPSFISIIEVVGQAVGGRYHFFNISKQHNRYQQTDSHKRSGPKKQTQECMSEPLWSQWENKRLSWSGWR